MISYKEFYERAEEFAKEYNEHPSHHVLDIMASVMMTRDQFMMGGGFVQSVIDNDLYGAINRGDNECIKNLKLIVATKHHCFLK